MLGHGRIQIEVHTQTRHTLSLQLADLQQICLVDWFLGWGFCVCLFSTILNNSVAF